MAYTGTDLNKAERGWVKSRSAINVKDYGAVGDGVTDDTEAIQNALDAGQSIYFPKSSGSYISSNLTITNDNTEIKGDGFATVIEFKTGSTGALLAATSKTVNIHDIRFFGGITDNQREVSAVTSNRIGLSIASQVPSLINKVMVDGFANVGIYVNDIANDAWERYAVSNCIIKNNHSGIDAGVYGEYTRYNNNYITRNYIGLTLKAGNINVNNNNIAKNGTGVYINGTGVANNGHGNLNNNLINHNDYPIYAKDVSFGYNILNNNIFEGILKIENCKNIKIANNILSLTEYQLSNTYPNFIVDNDMIVSYANTVTRTSDTACIIANNYFSDGSYLEDRSNKPITLGEDFKFNDTSGNEKFRVSTGGDTFARNVYGSIYAFGSALSEGEYISRSGNTIVFRAGDANRMAIDGGNGDVVSYARLKGVTATLSGLSTYADNTAALAGGLTAGMFYKTSTGVLMIVY